MKSLARILAATLFVVGLAASSSAPAQAAFGLSTFQVKFLNSDGSAATLAGSHPFAVETLFEVNRSEAGGVISPDEELKDLEVQLPVGFAGNPTATSRCSRADFLNFNSVGEPLCPQATFVGQAAPEFSFGSEPPRGLGAYRNVFNLQPPVGVAAELGFVVAREPVIIDLTVRKSPPYNVTATIVNTPQLVKLFAAQLIINGVAENGEPFLTLPRACNAPTRATYAATSWQHPEATPVTGESQTALELSGCEDLDFQPSIKAKPTSSVAESPSGLDFDLYVDDPGLTEAAGTAGSDLKKAVVTLPEGITTNPAIAAGLQGCGAAQYDSETVGSDPGTGCPGAAKIGTAEVETPLLEDKVLKGSIYVARQGDNPFHNLLTILMVIKDPQLGILIKAAGKVEPDPASGRLVTTFDDLPQLPFSHFHLHFMSGARAPLITPPTCGTFAVTADLYPYAHPDAPLRQASSFAIDAGANGSGCASGRDQLANALGFSAGTLDSDAGHYSPFGFRLNREDGTHQLSSISTTLPPGLVGKLAGIPYCSEGAIAQATARSGEGQAALELAQPSCPPASQLGTVVVGAGAGPEPYHVHGSAYLAGPYKGAPLSLEIITPALAGPFDLGVVAVRTALRVEPETAQVSAVSDPIPQILHGLPLDLRSVALNLNRPSFMLNPTSCEPKSILATATSPLASVASLSSYFQASSCGALGFEPELALRLKGGTKRNRFPALTATVTYPKGGPFANIARAQVTLPHSEFLEQGHIGTICTRVQFAARACPKGSIYGKAKAVSPLLDKPLEGPVYLRSSNHELPDLVADLRGQIEVTLSGRIDSVRGGIRTTFEAVPDAPVSRFTLQMNGGRSGLLVNSTDICARTNRANARFVSQSGKQLEAGVTLQAECGHGGKKKTAPGPKKHHRSATG